MGMFSPDENGWVRKEKYYQLKAENTQYKKQITYDEAGINLLEGSVELLEQRIKKYKQCLDDIEKVCNSCRENAYCFDCEYDNYCQSELQDYILQIIKQTKEVNDENR